MQFFRKNFMGSLRFISLCQRYWTNGSDAFFVVLLLVGREKWDAVFPVVGLANDEMYVCSGRGMSRAVVSIHLLLLPRNKRDH